MRPISHSFVIIIVVIYIESNAFCLGVYVGLAVSFQCRKWYGVFSTVPRPLGLVTGKKRYNLLAIKGFYTQLIMKNGEISGLKEKIVHS